MLNALYLPQPVAHGAAISTCQLQHCTSHALSGGLNAVVSQKQIYRLGVKFLVLQLQRVQSEDSTYMGLELPYHNFGSMYIRFHTRALHGVFGMRFGQPCLWSKGEYHTVGAL